VRRSPWGAGAPASAVSVSVTVRGLRVVEARVVLAQQIPPVVVAVRRPDHGVGVVARGGVVVEGDPALLVELDQDDGAVNPVVEDAVLVGAAHPREVGLREVSLHLVEPYRVMTGPDAAVVGLETDHHTT